MSDKEGVMGLPDITRFVSSYRTMYFACRSDYPCEGCEQPLWMACRNALRWAWRMR
jgi:hypothetical protein